MSIVLGNTITTSNLKEVNIKDNGELIVHTTSLEVVSEVLNEAQVRVGNFDDISVDFEDLIYDGMEIEIARARAVVISDAGVRTVAMTTESTVEDLLSEQGIEIGEDDEILIKKNSPTEQLELPLLAGSFIAEGMKLEVTRITYEYESIYEEIELEVEYVETDELYEGEQEVREEGSPKIVEHIIRHMFVNGELTESDLVEENVIDEGESKVIAVGTRVEEEEPPPPPPTPTPPSNNRPPTNNRPPSNEITAEGLETFTASLTFYLATCPGCTGITASGMNVRSTTVFEDSTFGTVRIVAADRRFPFGTIMNIEGHGLVVVLDRGGAVVGNVIDLLVGPHEDPWRLGRQSRQTTVLRMGW